MLLIINLQMVLIVTFYNLSCLSTKITEKYLSLLNSILALKTPSCLMLIDPLDIGLVPNSEPIPSF